MFRDIVIIVLFVSIGSVIGWFGHDYAVRQKLIMSPSQELADFLNPTNFRKLDIKLAEFPPEKGIEAQIGSNVDGEEGNIQLLNAFATTLYDEVASNDAQDKQATDGSFAKAKKEYRMVGVRIMGEVKNVGAKTVRGFLPSVSFYDKGNKLLATKRGYANTSSPFLPLETDEVGGYDIIVRDPPAEMEKIEIRLKASQPQENILWQALKVKDKSLKSHKSSEGSGEVAYYQFVGTLLNDSKETVEAPTVLVWVKNSEGRVVAMQSHSYTDDLLSPKKDIQASFLIRTNKLISNPVFEVRTFGRKYEK